MNLQDCLPAELRGLATVITPITAGFSGAGVHRVDAGERSFVLKLAGDGDAADAWPLRLRVLQLAANAGLAPRIVHVDPARRAVLSELVVDRSFPAFYGDPRTRDAAIAELGRVIRRVHELPIPPGLAEARPEDLLASTWAQLDGFPLPGFVADAVASVRAARPPASGEAPVLSHNDLNPTNMVYDGDRLVLLDWDAASTNDRAYDLATVAVFMRMDAETCAKLHAAYAGRPAEAMPPRFAYLRRLIAMMVGTGFVNAARQAGHPGTAPGATLESTLSLTDCYQRMRTGEVNLATPEGRMTFGLALVKESFVANESS